MGLLGSAKNIGGLLGKRIMPGDDPMMDRYRQQIWGIMGQPMPQSPPSQGDGRGEVGSFFGNLASSLGQAGAYMSGEWDTAAAIEQARQAERMAAIRAQMEARDAAAKRAADREDWQWKQEYEAAHPKPQQPYRTEDNVGNVWEIGADGQPRRIFTDTTPRYYIQGDRAVEIPNPYVGQQNAPIQPVGQLTPIDAPAPAQGGVTITQEQYQGAVNGLGKAGADAWVRRNNIRIRN